MRRTQRPFIAMRPCAVARAGIHHERCIRSDSLARRLYDALVKIGIHSPEAPPTDLECSKSFVAQCCERIRQRFRIFHQQRGIWTYTIAITPAQQAADRLIGDLSKDVP